MSFRLLNDFFAWPRSQAWLWTWVLFASFTLQAQSSSTSTTLTPAQEASRTGLTLVKENRLDEAIQTFAAGLKNDPQNLVLLNAIGATYTLKGDSDQAKKYFLLCLERDPQFIPARKNLAISYFNAGQYGLAAPELKRLMDTSEETRQTAQLFLGIIGEKQKAYSESVSMLAASGELLYRYPEAMISLAHSYSELQEPQKTAQVLGHLDTLPGITPSQHFQAGVIYSQSGQNRRGLIEFDKVAQTSPDFPGLAYQRASTLDKLGRSEEALKVLKVSTASQADANSLNLLARLAEQNHELALAFQSLRQAAMLEPEREDNYLDFSTLCLDHRNYPLALQAVEIGLEHVPNSYRLQVQKGAVLEKLQRFDQSEDVLRKASQLQPDNSAALLSLGIVQSHAGTLQDAVNTLSAAVLKFPDDSYMHYYLGSVLLQIDRQADNPDREREKKAEHEFKESIRVNPSFADSYYELSKVYSEKSPALAEQNLVECLKRDPNHASAEYALGRIYVKTGRQKEGQRLLAKFQSQQKAAKLEEQSQPSIAAEPE